MTRPSDRLLIRARTASALGILAAAVSLVVACGGTTIPTGTGSLPTLPGGVTSTPSGATGPTSGNLGDTLVMEDAGEDIAHVTMIKVFDPATGTGDDSPPDGTRWVGFEGTIVIDGSRAGQDSIAVEAIGSDGQTYGADTAYSLSTFDGCTATDESSVGSGQTQTFCAGVGLPPGVTVAKIGYSTEGVDGSSITAKLFWTVAASSAPAATDTPSPSPTDTPSPSPSDTPSPSPSATATPAT